MNFAFSKRRILVLAVIVLLGLFLLRPGASRLKTRIANSLSRAVERPVEIGSVHLRFLPQPGFDLENLTVYEDPAFGAEPMLRAPEVTAVVRLTSLIRGRLDISRLELTEPSLNLVRRQDGRWNWESLLERTARSPLAPTAKSKLEARPGFPYVEASSGRINFKNGAEKKPYALLNADFSLWQESENVWGVRLKAEPLRTDMSLSDTGTLRMSGIWGRAGSLRQTPLQFSMEWEQAQLGQLSKLLSGSDKGWRGGVRLDATLSGSPAAMRVSVDSSIQDFHRYDIPSSEGLRLAAHCDAKYNSAEGVLHEIFCNAPVGNGAITLHGDTGMPGIHQTELALDMENVPGSAIAVLARRTKKNLPPDLASTGTVQANFSLTQGPTDSALKITGAGEITNFGLQSPARTVDLDLGTIPFMLTSEHGSAASLRKSEIAHAEIESSVEELRLEYGPFPVALGRPTPAQARGWVTRTGYGLTLRGDGEVTHTLRLATLLGLPALAANAEGTAQMNLAMNGLWSGNGLENSAGFSLPVVTGTAQLHNVRATIRGANGPIEILSAELHLLPGEAHLEKLTARAGDARWTGSVDLPRGCGTPAACVAHFNLSAEEVDWADLNQWLGSRPNRRRWYQVLTPAEPTAPAFLESVRASGKIAVAHFLIHHVSAGNVSAALDLERGKLAISNLRANVLAGTYRGDWHVSFSGGDPVCAGSGSLAGISLEQVADVMHDPWISGTADGTFQLTASGADSATFWQSADGDLQFDIRDGVFSHISLPTNDDPLRITQWQGAARLRGGKIEIEPGQLFSNASAYEVSGTASFEQELDFKIAAKSDTKSLSDTQLVYRVGGTVAEPRVTSTSGAQTQAQLKP